MLSLPSLQHQMQHAILRGQDGALAAVVAGNGIAAERRIAIHRNHYRLTLTDALAATFPALRQVVGADFFGQLARAFVTALPPRTPCLFEYGGDLAAFIETLPQARSLPYLADLARFEWAINAAYNAPDMPALDAGLLASLPPAALAEATFAPHPSLALLQSAFPVIDIWSLGQPGAPAEASVDLSIGGTCLAVFRQGEEVVWRRIDRQVLSFLVALASGTALGPACAGASPEDLPEILAAVVFAGAFVSSTDTRSVHVAAG